MSRPPSSRKSHHNEQTLENEIENSTGTGAVEHALYRQDEKQKQKHSEEAIESIHNVSTTSSHGDEAEATSSVEDSDPRDVEASIAEPPYTVFTASQKRFIVLLAACAGFFSAVSIFAKFDQNTSLTRCRCLQTYTFRLSIH